MERRASIVEQVLRVQNLISANGYRDTDLGHTNPRHFFKTNML